MRSLALLLLTTTLASAEPDLRKCAEKTIGELPPKERTAMMLTLDGKHPTPDLDAAEKRALADTFDRVHELYGVVEQAAKLNDATRVKRLAKQLESEVAALKPSTSGPDDVRHQCEVARAFAFAGQPSEARTHFDSAKSLLAKVPEHVDESSLLELLETALAMKDDALVKTQDTAWIAAIRKKGDWTDLVFGARMLGDAGESKRILNYAGEAKSHHDAVLVAILDGVKANDLAGALDILAKLDNARGRILELEQVWVQLEASERHSAPLIAAAKATYAIESKRGVDDFARTRLVEVLADIGLVKEAGAVAAHIKNAWMRAHAEALTARGLALVDRKAAVKLAHAALDRAKTKGVRTDVDDDKMEIEAADQAATSALARAGVIDEAKGFGAIDPIDMAIGLHDRPDDLAAWWKTAKVNERAYVLEQAVRRNPNLGDPAFLVRLCM